MRMTRILRITLKYKFVKPLTRRSEQQESAAKGIAVGDYQAKNPTMMWRQPRMVGRVMTSKGSSSKSEHFFGNESTQNRTKVHNISTNAVQCLLPPCRVVTNRASRIQSQIYLNFAEAMPIDGRAQVAPLQLCTIPVYKFGFSPISHISRLSQKIQVSPPSRTFENVKIKGCSVQNATPLVGDVNPFR